MKDIFIDNNIAKNFANPLDPEYKRLIQWLKNFDEHNPADNACLAVSNKLIAEYQATAGGNLSNNNIVFIIGILQQQGRLNKISNNIIKDFKAKFFTKTTVKHLRSRGRDHDHIPVVLLSHRKYALSIDQGFIYDITHFPKFRVRAATRPQDLPYDR